VARGVGVEIDVDALPVSTALRAEFDAATCREFALAGGDDYELAFSVPEERAGELSRRFAAVGCAATRIGRVTAEPGTRVLDADGNTIATPHAGWEHFSAARAGSE
jgi:thiamine-monophosphate kinase